MKSHPLRKEEDYQEIPLSGQIFIESSAGTGKTHTLETLYLRLIQEKSLALEDILVLTFTEAATKELKERVQSRLAQTGGMEHYVSRFSEAQIFTMHDFAGQILKDFAPALKIQDNFQLKTEEDLSEIYKKALYQFFRSHQGEIEENAKLLKGYDSFRSLIASKDKEASFAKLVKALTGLCKTDTLQNLESFLKSPESLELEKLWQGEERREIASLLKDWQGGLAPLKEILGDKTKSPFNRKTMESVSPYLKVLFNSPLRENSLWQDLENLTQSISFKKDNVEQKRTVLSRLLEFSTEPELFLKKNKVLPPELDRDFLKCKAEILSKRVPALLLEPLSSSLSPLSLWLAWHFAYFVISGSFRELEKLKEQENVYSFDDIIQTLFSAPDVLDEPNLLELKSRYQAILIDEFQDTDPVQWFIFSQIMSREETLLFMIGDPKQAIYGFRGADLSTFYQAKKEIRENNLAHFFHLPINRRSHVQLVDSFNAIFHKLFSKDHAIFQDSLYESVEAHEPVAPNLSENAPVTVLLTDPEVHKNSQILSFLHRYHEFLKEEAVVPEDCVILARSEKDLVKLVKLNKENKLNLPLSLYKEQTLKETPEAIATFDFLKALLAPHKHFTRLMLSPFFHLPLKLVSWLGQEEQEGDRNSLIGGLSLLWETLKEEKNFLIFLNQVEKFSRKTRRELSSKFSFLSYLERKELAELGFEERLILEGDQVSLSIFKQTFVWLTPFIGSRQEVLNFFQDLDSLKIDSPKSIPSGGKKTLLMTIHRSKGLEFPYVFVLGNNRLFSDQESKNLHFSFYENEKRKSDFFKQIKNKEKRQLTLWQEEKNLLYVALTRAEKKVFLVWSQRKDGRISLLDAFLYIILFPPASSDDLLQRLKEKIPPESLLDQLRLSGSFLHWEELIAPSAIKSHLERLENPDLIVPVPPPSMHEILRRSPATSSFSSLVNLTSNVDSEIVQSALPNESPLPKGAMTGLWIHRLLENIPFSSAKETQNPHEWSRKEIRLKGFFGTIQGYFLQTLQEDLPQIKEREPVLNSSIAMLWNLLKSPLAPLGLALCQTEEQKTLKEQKFTIKTYLGSAPVEAGQEGEILKRHLRQGFLTGVIDCLMEIEGKLYLFDWKTNFLGNFSHDYAGESLALVMQENSYHLQYGLYTIALKTWQKIYKPDVPFKDLFGGTFYLFTRAFLDAPQEINGIYWAEPDWLQIEELDHFFSDPKEKS